MSHAGFLRDHTEGEAEPGVIALIRAVAKAGERAVELPLQEGVSHVHEVLDSLPDAASAILDPGDLPILHFVAEAALAPRWMERGKVQYLRDNGLSDREIHDVVHVVSCFSYMNRLADSLGVGVFAAERQEWAARLFGTEALAHHRAWAGSK
ncbi:MAG: hypothetical protein KDA24_22755 [Deltaproteobacteria bacterium]|nr:hypothetical protein [Deltaproteobacteria bacterium]